MTFLICAVASLATAPITQAEEPMFSGLGGLHRKVTTRSAKAQAYFDQGLAFLFAFNHDEAIRSFTQATKFDPNCAMAWWGIATANGPHINNPMVDPDHAKAAWSAVTKAKALRLTATPVERSLIEAASARFAYPQPEDRSQLDRAYADAMRMVWQKFTRDADVGAIFAESMMDLRPWDLWRHDGSPQPGTLEIVSALRKVIALQGRHPLGLHLYIHAVEASPHPEWAEPAADKLRDLQPGLGHMVHMPSHIDVRTGAWKKAIVANAKAMKTDKEYRAKSPQQGFYRIYMAHNHHMLTFAAMMRGEYRLATTTIDETASLFPPEMVAAIAPIADGYMAMPLEVRVRFGKWDEVLDTPDFPDYFPLSRTLRHAARAVAYAAKGMTAEARLEQSLFFEGRKKIGQKASFGNNSAQDILTVATLLMNGEINVSEGETDKAVASLREGVRREDNLRYDEPPDWIQPVRHTLGAVLANAGRYSEAAEVYRADLKKLPNNGWSLYGLAESLEKLGHKAEATKVKQQFAKVWIDADTKISSSCLCIPGK